MEKTKTNLLIFLIIAFILMIASAFLDSPVQAANSGYKGQLFRVVETSDNATLTAMLDTTDLPRSLIEVYCSASTAVTFTVEAALYYDSDNVGLTNWRKIEELFMGSNGGETVPPRIYYNSYRYVRVSTPQVATSVIEITATGH